MKRKTVIVPGAGDLCPRCKQATQIRAHREVTAKQLKQPFYYSRWFYCTNKNCLTQMIMPDKFKVMKENQELWHDAGGQALWMGG